MTRGLLPDLVRAVGDRLSSSWAATVAVDRLSRRDDVWIARTASERHALYRLRYQIYQQEQGDAGGRLDHERGWFRVDGDEDALLIGCGPRHAPLATVRVQTWGPGEVPEGYARDHALHRFPGIERLTVSHVGYLMVSPELRGGLAAVGFVIGAMEVAARAARPDVLFAHAAPGLLERYRRLGFRPYGAPPMGSTRGIEVPLGFIPEPRWLRRSACFWAPVLLRLLDEGVIARPDPGLLAAFERPGIHTGLAHLRAAWGDGDHDLASLRAASVDAVLSVSCLLTLPPGVTLTVQGFSEADMLLLLDGSVQVEIDGEVVARRASGAVIGELAWLGRVDRRTATVRTTETTRALNLRGRSLQRLCERSDTLRDELTSCLRRVAADRYPSVHDQPPGDADDSE